MWQQHMVRRPGAWTENNGFMAQLKAVLFDLDGVLVDSHNLHYSSWRVLADELGLRFNRQLGDAFRGMEREECVRVLFEEFNQQPRPDARQAHELTERKNRLYQEMLTKAGPADLALPGARALLAALQAEGITRVVCSGSKNAKTVLARAQMADDVDLVVDRYDVVNTKPDPAIFTIGAARAGAQLNEVVGVEDAILGIQALRAAGIKAIGVGHYVDDGDLLVEHLQDLTIEAMRALVAPL
jgi:beta-phosphoglucomutase